MENQTPEVVMPQQPKSNSMLFIAIGAVILVTGIGIGLAMGMNFQSGSSTTSVSSTTLSPNWKTYVNNEAGFEFLYPSGLELKETGDGGSIKAKSGNNFSFIVVNDESLSISNFLTKSDKKSLKDNGTLHSLQVQSTKKTMINGLNVVQREEYSPDSDNTQVSTYFKNGSVVISMTITPVPGSDRDESLYNQILSTFKFLDQNVAQ